MLQVFRNSSIKIINAIPSINVWDFSGIQHGLHSNRLVKRIVGTQ